MKVPLPLRLESLRNSLCRECALHEGAVSVCVPSICYEKSTSKTSIAVLVLGEAPGYFEDQACEPFVGDSGQLLRTLYVGGAKLSQYADVYLGNTVRCRPPGNATPNKTQVKACSSYWKNDIYELRKRYKVVVVWCVGAVATKAVTGHSLLEAFRQQGFTLHTDEVTVGLQRLGRVQVFCTYHPAMLLRDKSRLPNVKEHALMLREFLADDCQLRLRVSVPKPLIAPQYIKGVKTIALDIETYGILEGMPEQTCFNPSASAVKDRVPPARQIVSVAIAWHNGTGTKTAFFNYQLAEHRRALMGWLAGVDRIVGMNLPFDISYLRSAEPMLTRLKPWQLLDLAVVNFLECDTRSEKSLKSIAPLLRVASYGAAQRYPSVTDQRLIDYNVQDAFATLLCVDELLSRLVTREQSEEVVSEWMEWWSDVLWECIYMGESGVEFNERAVRRIHNTELTKQQKLIDLATSLGYTLVGTGSRKSAEQIVFDAMDHLPAGVMLKETKVRHTISVNDENRAILLEHVGPGPHRQALETLDSFTRSRKLTSAATGPLLESLVHIKGRVRAYPSWFPVPTYVKDTAGGSGGTRQARITCRNPGIQTLPEVVRATFTTRYPGGLLMNVDQSQIELRAAAFLSGDRRMIQEYRDGVDRHWARALELFGDDPVRWALAEVPHLIERHVADPTEKTIKKWLRQAGKTVNFLILFRGGPPKLVSTIRRDIGIEVPLANAYECVAKQARNYPEFIAWQDSLIGRVRREGRIILPETGVSRTFGIGETDIDGLVPEIVNMPVQAFAAQLTLAWQIDLRKRLRAAGLRAKVSPVFNHYDSLTLDMPREEVRQVVPMLKPALVCNPFIRGVESRYGRSVPLEYEASIVAGRLPDGVRLT